MTESEVKTEVRRMLEDNSVTETDYIVKADVLAFVRSALADTVEAYRWSNALLNGYIEEGIADIIVNRSDCEGAGSTTLPVRFHDAVSYYTLYKAYSGEAEDQSDLEKRNSYLNMYNNALVSTPYHWSDTIVSGFIDDGVKEIRRNRTDTRIVTYDSGELEIPDYLKDALVDYTAAECLALRTGDKRTAEKQMFHLTKYKAAVFGGGK